MRASAALVAALCALPALLHATDSERSRIAAERKVMTERFVAEEKACTSRFAVTACVDDVHARRREAQAPLRERELTLDDAERQQRARERRQAIAQRQAEVAQRPVAPPEPEARVRQPLLGASAALRTPKRQDDGAARAAAAVRRVQEAKQRQDEARAAQERIERRQLEREAQGTPSRPLPVPASAPKAASSAR
jgi:hypothetical protein